LVTTTTSVAVDWVVVVAVLVTSTVTGEGVKVTSIYEWKRG
jgi:hypothetical protein